VAVWRNWSGKQMAESACVLRPVTEEAVAAVLRHAA